MLALMTPAFLVGLGNQLLWKFMNALPSGQAPWDIFAIHPYNDPSYNEGHPRNPSVNAVEGYVGVMWTF